MMQHNLAAEGRRLARQFKAAGLNLQSDFEKALYKEALEVQRSAKKKAPVDSGKLRASIAIRREGQLNTPVFYVGTLVPYAIFVEYGTRKQAAQPYLRPALNERRQQILQTLRDNVLGRFG